MTDCYCPTHDHGLHHKHRKCALRRIQELETLIDRAIAWDDEGWRDEAEHIIPIIQDMRKARESTG